MMIKRWIKPHTQLQQATQGIQVHLAYKGNVHWHTNHLCSLEHTQLEQMYLVTSFCILSYDVYRRTSLCGSINTHMHYGVHTHTMQATPRECLWRWISEWMRLNVRIQRKATSKVKAWARRLGTKANGRGFSVNVGVGVCVWAHTCTWETEREGATESERNIWEIEN